jgi:UDP-N-acetylglucosamine 2-epimerase
MEATMRAIVELKQQTVIFYPNQDAGADDIINVIKRYRRFPFIRVVKSLPRDDFLALMRVAAVIVGNSSAGIVEAPALKLPAVNIGTREWGRERGANVIDVPHDASAIKQAIQNASSSAFRRKLAHARNPYRGRKTPLLIARVLASIPLDDRLIQKRMTY